MVVRPLPRVRDSIRPQPAKAASVEIVVTEFGITSVTSLCPKKAESPIVKSPSLSVREVKFTFANAQEPIVLTLEGITRVVNPIKLLNALSPIEVTEVPIVSEEALRTSLKADSPIEVTVFGIVTEVMLCCSAVVFESLENALAAIDVTPLGIFTAPAHVKVLVVTTLLTILNVPPPLQFTV
jgi:hypothetical protein